MKNKSTKKKHNLKKKFNEFKKKKHLVKPIVFITILLLIQILILIYVYHIFSTYESYVGFLWTLLTFVSIIYFINIDKPMDYKLSWIILVALASIFTILLYIVLEVLPGAKQLTNKLNIIKEENKYILVQNKDVESLINENKDIDFGLSRYLSYKNNFPVYKNTSVKYYKIGEEYFEALKNDIMKAKHFIFMEFFIIRNGSLMDELLYLLTNRISDGVEVKLMYDGSNDYYLEEGYKDYLEDLGIQVHVFNAVRPILSNHHNNRNHRKLVSIDNKIAYTGGLNLADEYINRIDRFGHWKDSGIRLEGEAVRSISTMFMYLWNIKCEEKINILDYVNNECKIQSESFVQPFDDSPNDTEYVCENVYIDIINKAVDYVYIMTPYLVPSSNLLNAIKFCANRGVDIRIMIPGKADKFIPYAVAKSYYKTLIKSGVKLYEYTPGFLHSKAIISDDIVSVVGSINLDYRSFHLNYENGVLVYDIDLAKSIKSDFMLTQMKCKQITIEVYKEYKIIYRYFCKLMKLIAPLI